MHQFKIHKAIVLVIILASLIGCVKKEESSALGEHYVNQCSTREGISKSIPANCNIEFWDFMYKYTYTGIESEFYTFNVPCNESVFSVKYINSVHDHNEPDYRFILKMDPLTRAEFFQPGTYKVKEFNIGYNNLTSGGQEHYSRKDVTVVWEEVALDGEIYSGKGKIIFPSDFPHSSFTGYYYPAQEIPFEFPAK